MFGGVFALLIGVFQVNPIIRNRYLDLHRKFGASYNISVIVGGVGGLWIGAYAYPDIIARVGYICLASLWLITGFLGLFFIKAPKYKSIKHHRQWVLRNFALTFAGKFCFHFCDFTVLTK